MLASFFEIVGAEIARLAPNTPPAAWLPVAGYAGTTIGALIIAASALAIGRSRVAAIAAASAFVATSRMPDSMGLLLFALALLGVARQLTAPPKSIPRWAIPLPLFAGPLFRPSLLAWTFVGVGLASIADQVRVRGLAGRSLRPVIVATLAFIIVAARVPEASTSTPPSQKPLGHDRVTLKSFRALIANIPSGSALVDDDITTNVLMRAAARDLARANVRLTRVKNSAADVRNALDVQRVFALPHAQRDLSLQGFDIVDGVRAADRGLAEVKAAGRCAIAGRDWHRSSSLEGRTNLALVATDKDERGPVVIYLFGRAAPIRVDPVEWPARTLRGFSPQTFDQENPADRATLNAQETDDGLAGDPADIWSQRFVTRIAMWRMPDAAMSLAIRLSEPAEHAMLRLAPEATAIVSVCPAFPAPVSAIR